MTEKEMLIEVGQEFFRKHLSGRVTVTAVGLKYVEFERQDTGIVSIMTKGHFEYDYKLCPEIENTTSDGPKKLSLKSSFAIFLADYKASQSQ